MIATATTLPAGMKPYSPDHPDYPNAPGDVDYERQVIDRSGCRFVPWLTAALWNHDRSGGLEGNDIIAYTPLPATTTGVVEVKQNNEPRDAVQDLLDHLGQPFDGKWPPSSDSIDCRVNIGVLRRARSAYANRLAATRPAPVTDAGEVERLREALEPFAAWADVVDKEQYGVLPDRSIIYSTIITSDASMCQITAGNLRAARAALAGLGGQG